MNDDALLSQLPFARRYARMLLGRQDEADALVADALRHLARPIPASSRYDRPSVLLFRALHDVMSRRPAPQWSANGSTPREQIADQRLQSIPPMARAVLLLTAVEGFSEAVVADILDASDFEVLYLADEAQRAIEQDLETTVLIIEDEWAIARDLRRMVNTLGHEVVAVAATQTDAVDLAAQHRPGLVIADLQLADGSSGAEAASIIVRDQGTPIVFVTAYPGDLLQGRRTDPTYLITKPFSPSMIKTTVSQALFFS